MRGARLTFGGREKNGMLEGPTAFGVSSDAADDPYIEEQMKKEVRTKGGH